MRLLKHSDLSSFSSAEQFFIQSWYSKTHSASLDTYRVRCMNSRTILRELYEELSIGLIKLDELWCICAEAYEILEHDPVLKDEYENHISMLLPKLKNPEAQLSENKNDKKSSSKKPELKDLQNTFHYAVKDFYYTLEASYFEHLCKALVDAVKDKKLDVINSVMGALLSDLIDRGWVMSALWQWHKHFIKTGKKYSFEKNLSFMLNQFKREKQKFTVTLRMQGGKEFSSTSEFGGFKFTQTPDLAGNNPREKSFFKPHSLRYFATKTVMANEDISAAMLVREKLETIFDLFRFEFSAKDAFKIHDTAYVLRDDDGAIRMPKIHREIPNPQRDISYKEFMVFADKLHRVRDKTWIKDEDKRQFDAALRQYRFGRDSEGHVDKFLNWWMGLEDLCPHDKKIGGIGPSVIHYTSRVLAIYYFKRILSDYVSALKYCEINWSDKLSEGSGCKTLDGLCIATLLKIFQNHALSNELWDQCNNEILVFEGQKLAKCFSSSEKAKAHITRHLKHLEWHLARLYRIRCCIVHGSEIRLRLDLVTANLEYYLKQVFSSSLNMFSSHGHVSSLREFFERAAWALDQQVELLSKEGTGLNAVYAAVYTEPVQTEKYEEPRCYT